MMSTEKEKEGYAQSLVSYNAEPKESINVL